LSANSPASAIGRKSDDVRDASFINAAVMDTNHKDIGARAHIEDFSKPMAQWKA
jgi:hypothetical protein